MGIASGKSTGAVAILEADTVLSNALAGESQEFYAGTIHNSSAGSIDVQVFLSTGAASAGSPRIEMVTLDAGRSHRLAPVLIPPGGFLLALASAEGCNFNGIFTRRTGVDV